ncbi:hypothetical protein PPS11_05357 [Pseudomonas putida S11]|nr:hypothetical protein PPS11_05357 [Pseudomonas putida S11]
MDFIRIIIAIILPPLGVFLQVGFGGAFWLNILLTLLGYIAGDRACGVHHRQALSGEHGPCRSSLVLRIGYYRHGKCACHEGPFAAQGCSYKGWPGLLP